MPQNHKTHKITPRQKSPKSKILPQSHFPHFLAIQLIHPAPISRKNHKRPKYPSRNSNPAPISANRAKPRHNPTPKQPDPRRTHVRVIHKLSTLSTMPKTPSTPRHNHHTPGGIPKPRPENAPRRAKCRHHPPKTKPRLLQMQFTHAQLTPTSRLHLQVPLKRVSEANNEGEMRGSFDLSTRVQLPRTYTTPLYHRGIKPPCKQATLRPRCNLNAAYY